MKRFIALILCIFSVFALFGCSAPAEETTAPTEATELLPEVQEKKNFSAYANIVADPKTWYEGLMALPIANDSMTEDELRQLCVDAMRYNLTFVWTPNQDINYSFTLLERTSEVSLPQYIAYSGLFYCNNNARGNVWKALNYYDPETGVIDITAMDGRFLGILSSACARGCEWGWGRVSNSHGLETMSSYNQYNSNIVLVGTYNYQPGKYAFGNGSGTKDIIAHNGEDVIFESYAMMKPADGVYSSSSYHVMMISEAPVIVYDDKGQIDPAESYVLVLEQDAVGSKTDKQDIIQSNGVTLRQLGGVDNKYTFLDLLEKGYIPFTVKELVGQDPVEAGEAWIGTPTAPIANGTELALEDLLSKTVHTNYAICTMEIQVKDPNGQVMVRRHYDVQSTPMTTHTALSNDDFAAAAAPYANGTNTVHVYVRLSTGELKEAFTTVLTVS